MEGDPCFCPARWVVTVPVWWEAPCTGRLHRERNWSEEKTGRQVFFCFFFTKTCLVLKWNKVVSHFLVCSQAKTLEGEAGCSNVTNSPSRQHRRDHPDERRVKREVVLQRKPAAAVLIIPTTSTVSDFKQCESHWLCRRSLVKCNPFLPSPWGLVSRCAEDCRDPPCCSNNDEFSRRSRQQKRKMCNAKWDKCTYVLILTCHS